MQEFFSFMMMVSYNVLIIYLLIAVGFVITKCKLLGTSGIKQITDIILYIVTPCVIIKAFCDVRFSAESVVQLAIAAGCAVFAHLLGLALGLILFKRRPDGIKNVLTAGLIFSNCGYMGTPLAQGIIGSEGVFIASVYIGVFNVFLWTVGLMLFSNRRPTVRKIFINPGIIAVAIGMTVFFAGLTLPGFVYEPIRHLASLNTPLAMIVIGFYIAGAGIKWKKGDGYMYLAMAVRMLVIPLICLSVFVLCGIRGITLIGCMIPISAPCAAVIMMFAAKFDADGETASRMVSVSHLFSVLTMPLVLTLCVFAQ